MEETHEYMVKFKKPNTKNVNSIVIFQESKKRESYILTVHCEKDTKTKTKTKTSSIIKRKTSVKGQGVTLYFHRLYSICFDIRLCHFN